MIVPMALVFEWDGSKAAGNLRKHRVGFLEAASVFADPLSITIPDPDHSGEEERFVILGMSRAQRLLVVVHTVRGERIRLITARTPTHRERLNYEQATNN